MLYLNLNEKKTINDVTLLGTSLITPDIAKNILENNPNNRRINDKRVSAYASDMINGWDSTPTGLSITLDRNNNLIDGQHRLNAIIKSGKPMEMFLFKKDVSLEVNKVICDNGFTRNNSFLTGLSSNLTSTVSSIIRFNSGSCANRVTAVQIESFINKLSSDENRIVRVIGDTNKKGLSCYVKAPFILYYLATHNSNTLTIWNNLKERVLVKDSTEYNINLFIENLPPRRGCSDDKNTLIGIYSRLKGFKRTSAEPEKVFEEVKAVYKAVMARDDATVEIAEEPTSKEPSFALF